MSPLNLCVRRATVDDLETLKALWVSMRLPADELEKRLTEFQVVETDGRIAGAIGIQISKQHALLHSEGYSDFSVADAARQLFWERIQTLASNHGVFRLWTQEDSPFWLRWGFQPASDATLSRLPEPWKGFGGKWLTLQLKNEEAITDAIEKELTQFMVREKLETKKVLEKAKTINTIITVIGFAIGFLGIGFAVYLFVHRNPFPR